MTKTTCQTSKYNHLTLSLMASEASEAPTRPLTESQYDDMKIDSLQGTQPTAICNFWLYHLWAKTGRYSFSDARTSWQETILWKESCGSNFSSNVCQFIYTPCWHSRHTPVPSRFCRSWPIWSSTQLKHFKLKQPLLRAPCSPSDSAISLLFSHFTILPSAYVCTPIVINGHRLLTVGSCQFLWMLLNSTSGKRGSWVS